MIKDFSFGQFYPQNSIIHKLDPRIKLVLLIAYIVFVFLAFNFYSLGLVTFVLITLIAISKVPVSVYLKSLKVIIPIVIFTSILNAAYVTEGNLLCEFWVIKIYDQGIYKAIFMSLRILILVLSSSVLSFTTTPTELTDAIESLFSPLKFVGLSSAVHSLAMMMTIALRFIPTLIEETDKIMSSQKARGASFESGGLIKKVKALMPVLIPLLISAIRRAYELAEAMECRCYNCDGERTSYRNYYFEKRDFTALLFALEICAVLIIIKVVQ